MLKSQLSMHDVNPLIPVGFGEYKMQMHDILILPTSGLVGMLNHNQMHDILILTLSQPGLVGMKIHVT
jgi:hypothetical protein